VKKVLIISPYFAPVNAADTQRVRMSLSYYQDFGWEPQVVCVHEKHADLMMDDLLLKSIPSNIKVHKVNAFPKKWTSKMGLGSIALRSLRFYKAFVNELLQKEHFDLIYFSTTQFPVLILGNYWKRKFNIPYVIDMQDPWHTDYYEDKPKAERPKKYWFSYHLNKALEPMGMKDVGGIISVSTTYIETLLSRYPQLEQIPTTVIPFGAHWGDFEVANQYIQSSSIPIATDKINIVYTGAVGSIMKDAIEFLCQSLAILKTNDRAMYHKIRLYFVGTSYAPDGQGTETVVPIAKKYQVEDVLMEQTDRIGFYESLYLLQQANALLVLGSDDNSYNPSKVYTYLLTKKPILGIFKTAGQAFTTLESCGKAVVDFIDDVKPTEKLIQFLTDLQSPLQAHEDDYAIDAFSSKSLTKKQVELFEKVVGPKN
jgi:hypothetical protein